jgi:eukaryotic-like serine/threonine-protein kinase
MPIAAQYRAFLSYSHKDRKWGDWLHKKLEGYRIDRDLVGRETAAGVVPKTLRPIFRDRDDFAGGPSLQEATLRALEASDFLIVICSPNARMSHYVNEEVRLFKALGRAERVIPIIIDGEPGDPARECFPSAVTYNVGTDGQISTTLSEPIAADARQEGDGPELAIHKVIAGLLGVGLDEIRKRAARAQRRRIVVLGSVASLTTGLALVAGIAAWIARERTIEAEQRLDWALETAGGITTKAVTFKDKFGVPAPVLSELLAQVDQLLQRMAEAGVSSADIKIREAKLLEALSDNNKDLGSTTKALEQANKAASTFESVVAAGVNVGTTRNDLGWAYMKAGDLYEQQNMLEGAKNKYLAAKQVFTSLLDTDPNNDPWRMSFGASLVRLSDIWSAEGNLDDAAAALDQALDIQRAQSLIFPRDTYHSAILANSLSKRAAVAQRANDNDKAVVMLKEALAIDEQLVKTDPSNANWASDLAFVRKNLGYSTERQGNLQDAITYYNSARETFDRLSSEDPLNVTKLVWLANSLDTLGYNYQRTGRQSDAASAFDRMVAIRRKILAQDPANAAEKATLAISLNRLASAQVNLGNSDSALSNAEEALGLTAELIRSNPTNADLKFNRVIALGVVALIRTARGNQAGAASAYDEMVSLTDKIASVDPADANKAYASITSHVFVGGWYRQTGRPSEALKVLEPARLSAEDHHQHAPNDPVWLMALSQVYARIYEVNWDLGDMTAALRTANQCLEYTQRWSVLDSGNNEALERLGEAFTIVGNSYRRVGKFGEAEKAHSSGIEIRKKLVAGDPNNVMYKDNLAVSWSRLADVFWDKGDYAQALSGWNEAISIMKNLVEYHRGNQFFDEELAYSHDSAGSALTRLDRRDDAIRAYRSALAIRQVLAKAQPENVERSRNLEWTLQQLHDLGDREPTAASPSATINDSQLPALGAARSQ